MNVTLPNGSIIQGVPEGTTKEQIMQKAIASGLATEQDFGITTPPVTDTAPVSNIGDDYRPAYSPSYQTQTEMKDSARQVEAAGSQPQGVFGSPELNELSMRAFKSGVGGLLTGDVNEIQQIIQANYPEAEFGDLNGQPGVRLPSGEYYLQPEGVDLLDVARFGTDVAAFTPAGRVIGTGAKQLVKGATVAGLTQSGLQGVEAAVGGEFNPEDVAIEAATQGAFQVAAPVVKSIASPILAKFGARLKAADETVTHEEVASAISSGKASNVVPQIMADPEVLKAADDLGINISPGVASTSEVYREFENALKMAPESKLSAGEKEAIAALGQKSDDLIREWVGTTDKSQVSADFSEKMLSTVRKMEDEASALYGSFDDLIDSQARLQPAKLDTVGYIKGQIDDLGGIRNIDSQLAKIYKAFTKEGGPTQALINKFRRDVGSALKGQGPFKDAGQAELKQLYGSLAEDSLKIPQLLGLEDEVRAARSLVKERKKLEETLQGALGKDLSKSIMAEVGIGVRQLQSGKTSKFDSVMASIPKADRQDISISALNDIFSGGSTKSKQSSLTGFVSSYEALQRNPTAANKLWENIPSEVRDRVDAIYRVSKGIAELNKKELNNPSGSARAIVNAWDARGLSSKLYKVAGQMAAGAGASAPFDAGVTGAGIGFLNAMRASKTKASAVADEFLSSPELRTAAESYVKGDEVAANKILSGSVAAAKWLASQSPATRRAITRQGFIQYLSGYEE